MKRRDRLFVLFITALLLRGALFVATQRVEKPFFRGDAWEYELLARNILNKGTFSLDLSGPPDARRTPLYPLFIALSYFLFGQNASVAVIFQILLSSLSVVFMFLIGEKLLGEKIAFIAALLFAADPLHLFLSQVLLTETLFTFLLLLATYFAIKRGKSGYLLSGAFLGFSALTRPVALYLIPLYLLFFLLEKEPLKNRIRGSLFALLAFAITLTPWLLRNYRHFGRFSLSSLTGYNLYYYNAGILRARLEGQKVRAPWAVKEVVGKELMQEAVKAGIEGTPFDSSRTYLRLALKRIGKNLPLYLSLHAQGTLITLFSPGIHYLLDYLGFEKRETGTYKALLSGDIKRAVSRFVENGIPALLMVFETLFLLLLYVLAAYGFIFRLKKGEKWPLLFALVLIYFVLAAGPIGEGRYRAPADPFLLLLAASGAPFCSSVNSDRNAQKFACLNAFLDKYGLLRENNGFKGG
ncbi:MAG: glycosyltransferase family 39 protein [Candidatus Hydrothermae bacterium]|nr:glycosyltransferase family 39 protein [Candidatus Hydrothermae bacterium]